MERKRILKRLYGEPPKFDPAQVEDLLRDVVIEEGGVRRVYEKQLEAPAETAAATLVRTDQGMYKLLKQPGLARLFNPEGEEIGPVFQTWDQVWDENGFRMIANLPDGKKGLVNEKGELFYTAEYQLKRIVTKPESLFVATDAYQQPAKRVATLLGPDGQPIVKDAKHISAIHIDGTARYIKYQKGGLWFLINLAGEPVFKNMNNIRVETRGGFTYFICEWEENSAVFDQDGAIIADDAWEVECITEIQGRPVYTVQGPFIGTAYIASKDGRISDARYKDSIHPAESDGEIYYCADIDGSDYVIGPDGEPVSGPFEEIYEMKTIGGKLFYRVRKEGGREYLYNSEHKIVGQGYKSISALFDVAGKPYMNVEHVIPNKLKDTVKRIAGPNGFIWNQQNLQIKSVEEWGYRQVMHVEQQIRGEKKEVLLTENGHPIFSGVDEIVDLQKHRGMPYAVVKEIGLEGVYNHRGLLVGGGPFRSIWTFSDEDEPFVFFATDTSGNLVRVTDKTTYALSDAEIGLVQGKDHGKSVWILGGRGAGLISEDKYVRKYTIAKAEVGPHLFFSYREEGLDYVNAFTEAEEPFGPFEDVLDISAKDEETLVIIFKEKGKIIERHYDISDYGETENS